MSDENKEEIKVPEVTGDGMPMGLLIKKLMEEAGVTKVEFVRYVNNVKVE